MKRIIGITVVAVIAVLVAAAVVIGTTGVGQGNRYRPGGAAAEKLPSAPKPENQQMSLFDGADEA